MTNRDHGIKGKLFTINEGSSLLSRRLERLKNFKRVPPSFLRKLLFFYIKKMFGGRGTEDEIADNYYFLTLINCNATSLEISDDFYVFQNNAGTKFTARRNPSSDLEVFNQVWGRDDYIKATDLIDGDMSSDLVIVDAGANVGYTSLFFNQLFPAAKIIAIEPDLDNLAILKRNIDLNSASNITVVHAGIWSHACNLLVDKSFRDNREWSFQVKEVDHETGLKGMHILKIINQYTIGPVGLLKIDIEGSEKHIFTDAPETSEFLGRTGILALEIHDEEVSRELIYGILKKNGFSYFDYSDLTIAEKMKDYATANR